MLANNFGMSVLIADDDDLIRDSLSSSLKRVGYRVLTAENGVKALKILKRENVAIVLLDIFMPENDGLETLLFVRRASPQTRVIVMSGLASEFDYLNAARKLGADECMRKPVKITELLSVLAKINSSDAACFIHDRRLATRISTDLEGQIFNLANWRSTPCRVLNLSEGGALVECDSGQLPHEPVVLYVAHFGRYEVRIAHRSAHLVGLQFAPDEAKRNRLRELLKFYAEHGEVQVATRRKYIRVQASGRVTMLRESGREATCDVLDISPEGVSLRTEERPPVGEIVCLGETRGRIVRHHDEGVALTFFR